jgi:hypothetical protein
MDPIRSLGIDLHLQGIEVGPVGGVVAVIDGIVGIDVPELGSLLRLRCLRCLGSLLGLNRLVAHPCTCCSDACASMPGWAWRGGRDPTDGMRYDVCAGGCTVALVALGE